MNKNQKRLPYTRSALISGNRYSMRFHVGKIEALETRLSNPKITREELAEIKTQIVYHLTWVEYFKDAIARLTLNRMVCGNATTLIR